MPVTGPGTLRLPLCLRGDASIVPYSSLAFFRQLFRLRCRFYDGHGKGVVGQQLLQSSRRRFFIRRSSAILWL